MGVFARNIRGSFSRKKIVGKSGDFRCFSLSLQFIPWKEWISWADTKRSTDSNTTKRVKLEDDKLVFQDIDVEITPSTTGALRMIQVFDLRIMAYLAEKVASLPEMQLWHEELIQAAAPLSLETGWRAPRLFELEEIDEYFWNRVFETSSSTHGLTIDAAMRHVIAKDIRLHRLLQPKLDLGSKNPKENDNHQNNTNRRNRDGGSHAIANHTSSKHSQHTSSSSHSSNTNTKQNNHKHHSKPRKGNKKGRGGVRFGPHNRGANHSSSSSQNHHRNNPAGSSKATSNDDKKVNSDDFRPFCVKGPRSTCHVGVFDCSGNRELIDGGGVESPGVIFPEFRSQSEFWGECLEFFTSQLSGLLSYPPSTPDEIFDFFDSPRFASISSAFGDQISARLGFRVDMEIHEGQPFRLGLVEAIAKAANDEDAAFLSGLDAGRTIGFNTDLGSNPRVFPDREKCSNYDDPRPFSGNYISALDRPAQLDAYIASELAASRIEGPFSLQQLEANWGSAINICAIGIEEKNLSDPSKIRVLVDATQGGVNQNIALSMAPKRPGLVDALRAVALLKQPSFVKWDAAHAHRCILTPRSEWGRVTIQDSSNAFFVNKVGTFGVSSAGQNWDRLASACHRWILHLLAGENIFAFIFSDDTLLVGEAPHLPRCSFLAVCFLKTIGYPFARGKFWVNHIVQWLGFTLNAKCSTAQVTEVKRRSALEKIEAVTSTAAPLRFEIDSAVGTLSWMSQLAPQLRPFLSSLYCYSESFQIRKSKCPPHAVVDELLVWKKFLAWIRPVQVRALPLPSSAPRIFTDACAHSAFIDDDVSWASGLGIGGFLLGPDGEVDEWFASEVTLDDFPWFEAVPEQARLIAFLELLATFVATWLWSAKAGADVAPSFHLPLSADNLGNVFVVKKLYTSKRPLSWLVQELALLTLERGVNLCLSHRHGEADRWTGLADALSRGRTRGTSGTRKRFDLRNFPWALGLRSKSKAEVAFVYSLKERKRIEKAARRAKGGVVAPCPRVPAGVTAERKRRKKIRELEIQEEIDLEQALAKGGDGKLLFAYFVFC